MNSGISHQELREKSRNLLLDVATALPRDTLTMLAEFIDVAEFGLFIEMLTDRLLDLRASISAADLDAIAQLSSAIGLPANMDKLSALVRESATCDDDGTRRTRVDRSKGT